MTSFRKISRLRSLLRGLEDSLDQRMHLARDRLFRADDAAARAHGWQIEAHRGGLGRSYRAPRFDSLLACPVCSGIGDDGARPCPRCAGTGRIVLSQSSHFDGGRR